MMKDVKGLCKEELFEKAKSALLDHNTAENELDDDLEAAYERSFVPYEEEIRRRGLKDEFLVYVLEGT